MCKTLIAKMRKNLELNSLFHGTESETFGQDTTLGGGSHKVCILCFEDLIHDIESTL